VAPFLYFLPGEHIASAQVFSRVGLGAVLGSGVGAASVECLGPDERQGVLAWVEPWPGAEHPRYDAAGQTWRRVEGGKYWLGFVTGALPGPDELLRADVGPGWRAPLSDGHAWIVPGVQHLPRLCEFVEPDDALPGVGQWVESVLPEYAAMEATGLALKAIYDFEEGEADKPPEMPMADLCEACVSALAVNHRVGRHEVTALGLLTQQDRFLLAHAMADTLGEVAKALAAEQAEKASSEDEDG